eukprot:gene614-665_t
MAVFTTANSITQSYLTVSNANVGTSLNGVGDINKDGYDDYVVQGIDASQMAYAYLIFGSATSSASSLDLSTISASNGNGLKIMVADASSADDYDLSFSNVGDVNHDGYQDFAIGTSFAGTGGKVFVIFGKATYSVDLDLMSSSLVASTNGFTLTAGGTGYQLGYSVSGLGDFNGDGIDDFIVSAPSASVQNTNAGGVWIVYGSASISDQTLSGGTTTSEHLYIGWNADEVAVGFSVAGPGDINGDSYPDALIGSKAGMAWVIYGRQSVTSYDLPSNIPAAHGYMVPGGTSSGTTTTGVAKAGDFDGDGINDFLVTKILDTSVSYLDGLVFVVYGEAGTSRTNFVLSSSSPGNYTKIYDSSSHDYKGLGWSVAGGVDYNKDGFADILVGSPGSDCGWVAYGLSAKPAAIDVANLISFDGHLTNGFNIIGASGGQIGYAVAFAGDLDKDGQQDILIGAPISDVVNYQGAGSSYTIYGASSQMDVQLTAMTTFSPTLAPTLAPTMAPSAAPTTPNNQQDDGHSYDDHLSRGDVAALVVVPIVGVTLIACVVYWVISCMRASAVTTGDAVPQHESNV